MSIPETQLETWSNQGAMTTATQTYNSIRNALADGLWPTANTPDIYLQGSYRNSTNIYAESDVDVIVEIQGVAHWDTSELAPLQALQVNATFRKAPYLWEDGYRDTLATLRDYYGYADVRPGKKAIQVRTPYRTADVVVAVEFQKYQSLLTAVFHVSGIAVWVEADCAWLTNFPRQHYDNGVQKNARTGGLFKPTVRLFKNANRYMVEQRKLLAAGTAPSYAIECLVYSAPNECFNTDYGETFCKIVNWADQNLTAIRRVSERGSIVGSGRGLWNLTAGRSYVDALAKLWNGWWM